MQICSVSVCWLTTQFLGPGPSHIVLEFRGKNPKLTVQRPGKVDLVVEESPTPEHHRLALVHLGVLGQHRKLELGPGQCCKEMKRWKFKLVTYKIRGRVRRRRKYQDDTENQPDTKRVASFSFFFWELPPEWRWDQVWVKVHIKVSKVLTRFSDVLNENFFRQHVVTGETPSSSSS